MDQRSSGYALGMKYRDPEKVNRSKPHHPILKSADDNYTFCHALKSTRPIVHQLPPSLTITLDDIIHLYNLVVPDGNYTKIEESWKHLQRHIVDHDKDMPNMRLAIFDLMRYTDTKLQEAREYLTGEGKHAKVPSIDRFLKERRSIRRRMNTDLKFTYMAIASEMLLCYIQLRLANSIQGKSEDINEFSFYLIYPKSRPAQYNLNIVYKAQIEDKHCNRSRYLLLSGFNLGESEAYSRGEQDIQQAVYLTDWPLICTTFGDFDNPHAADPDPNSECLLIVR